MTGRLSTLALLFLILAAACDDYTLRRAATLREKPGANTAECARLVAGDGVDCVGEKLELGCAGYQDNPDGRWFAVETDGTHCWARLDWFDDQSGPLAAANARIASSVTHANFDALTARAKKAARSRDHWKCAASYLEAAKLEGHPKASQARELGQKCELLALRGAVRKAVLFSGREGRGRKLYSRCRSHSSYIRRALQLERTLKQEAPDGHVARALTTCVSSFARAHIAKLRLAPWSRRHASALKRDLERCDTDLAGTSRKAFQARLKKVIRKAAAARRDPRTMTFEPAALRWGKSPDRLEIELRYAPKRSFYKLADRERYWTLLTFCFRDGSWYVDRDNPFLTSW